MEPKDLATHGNWFPKFGVLNELESFIADYSNAWSDDNDIDHHFPTRLKELRLYRIPLRPALLSAIAALPELEILDFMESTFMEDKWDTSEDMYQSLKTLSLRLIIRLSELTLEYCYKLREIPCAFRDIDTLKSIHLTNIFCEVVDSAIEIKTDVAAFTGEDRLDVHEEDVYDNSREEEEI